MSNRGALEGFRLLFCKARRFQITICTKQLPWYHRCGESQFLGASKENISCFHLLSFFTTCAKVVCHSRGETARHIACLACGPLHRSLRGSSQLSTLKNTCKVNLAGGMQRHPLLEDQGRLHGQPPRTSLSKTMASGFLSSNVIEGGQT